MIVVFIKRKNNCSNDIYYYFHEEKCKLYEVVLDNEKFKEIEINFNKDYLIEKNSTFANYTEYLNYVCLENIFCTLEKFMNSNIIEDKFSKTMQYKVYSEIAENIDGSCGEKIHTFVTRIIEENKNK